jgi:hypothetical protein
MSDSTSTNSTPFYKVEHRSGDEVFKPDDNSRVAMVVRIGIDPPGAEGAEESPFVGWGFNRRFLDLIEHDLNHPNPEHRGTLSKVFADSMRDMAVAIESGAVLKHREVGS